MTSGCDGEDKALLPPEGSAPPSGQPFVWRVLRAAGLALALIALVSADVWQSLQESSILAGLGEDGDVSNAVALARSVYQVFGALFNFLVAPVLSIVGALAEQGNYAAIGRVLRLGAGTALSAGALCWVLFVLVVPIFVWAVSWQTLSLEAQKASRLYANWIAPSLPLMFLQSALASVALAAGSWQPLAVSFTAVTVCYTLLMQLYVRRVDQSGVVAAVAQTMLLNGVVMLVPLIHWLLRTDTWEKYRLGVPAPLSSYQGLVGSFGFSAAKAVFDAATTVLVIVAGSNISSIDALAVRAAAQVVTLVTLVPGVIGFGLQLKGGHLVGRRDGQGLRRLIMHCAAAAAAAAAIGIWFSPSARDIAITVMSTDGDRAQVRRELYDAWAAIMLANIAGSVLYISDAALVAMQLFRVRAVLSAGSFLLLTLPLLVVGRRTESSHTIILAAAMGQLAAAAAGAFLLVRRYLPDLQRGSLELLRPCSPS